MKTILSLTCLALALSPLASAHCPTHQIADAQSQAAAEKKDVLLVFLGGDWDPVSKKVQADVLSTEEFKKKAAEHFVTHVMEFAKSPKDTDKALLTLREKYQVNGLPAIIQVDPQGRPYGFAGLRNQKTADLLSSLKSNVETREKRDAAFKKGKKAKGLERAKAIVEGLELLPQFILLDFYSPELAMIAEADPKGETGLVARVEKADKLDQEQKRYQLLFKEEKLDEVVALSKKESAKLKGEDAQRVSMFGIQALASQKKYDEAKKAIDAMAKLDPETAFGKSAERYKGVVDRIKARSERPAPKPRQAAKPKKDDKKKASGPIVSKPVAVVTDINKLREEGKKIATESQKATALAQKAVQTKKEADQEIALLSKKLKTLQEGKAERDAAAEKAQEEAAKLASKSKMMSEVIENHEAMEKRKREISDLEKKAAALQKQAEELRKQASEIKKSN